MPRDMDLTDAQKVVVERLIDNCSTFDELSVVTTVLTKARIPVWYWAEKAKARYGYLLDEREVQMKNKK